MAGRGAWNAKGVGGTKQYKDAAKPGSYYFTGSGYPPAGRDRDANEYAVYGAVKAYQEALIREGFPCYVDGLYGNATTKAMTLFQQKWVQSGDPKASVWGGVGPETSERLLSPLLRTIHYYAVRHPQISATLCAGIIRSESQWDAGAVGAVDETDVGLAQINASAHPQWSTDMRLQPETSFEFIISYLTEAMVALSNNLRDSIASYNLGVAGAKKWIAAGRPDLWAPPGTDPKKPRDVKDYIDRALKG